jgi:hypothetical protein
LWQVSGKIDTYHAKFSRFLVSHLENKKKKDEKTDWESIREDMRKEPLVITVPFAELPTVEQRKDELVMLLLCLSSGIASTEMLRRADGAWKPFTLPGNGSPPA